MWWNLPLLASPLPPTSRTVPRCGAAQVMDSMEQRRFDPGAVVINEGGPGDFFYVTGSGELEVKRGSGDLLPFFFLRPRSMISRSAEESRAVGSLGFPSIGRIPMGTGATAYTSPGGKTVDECVFDLPFVGDAIVTLDYVSCRFDARFPV